MGYYQSGDWYQRQGSYYGQGDPGLFSWVGKAIGSAGRFLGSVGARVGPVVSKIFGVAAPIVGGIFGGPAGAALGGAVGSLAQGGGDLMGAMGYTAPDPTPVTPAYTEMYTQTAPPPTTFIQPGTGYRGQPYQPIAPPSYTGWAPQRTPPPRFGIDWSQGPGAEEDYDVEEEMEEY